MTVDPWTMSQGDRDAQSLRRIRFWAIMAAIFIPLGIIAGCLD